MKNTISAFFFLFFSVVYAGPPADISFLVADLKYSEEQGVKICEIQQACLSLFKGYDYIYEGEGLIGINFCELIQQFHKPLWYLYYHVNYTPLKKRLVQYGWREKLDLESLCSDYTLNKIGGIPPADPHNIDDYQGIVYLRPKKIDNLPDFKNKYPGILLIDLANMEYFSDKFKMSKLFLNYPDLEEVKPKWNLYPKEYTPDLAQLISQELGGKIFVIKPRGAAEGRGVIVVKKNDLDKTLRLILTGDKNTLLENPDKGYSYWANEPSDTFIVEEFIQSDPIKVPFFDNRSFNCTMRVVFVLMYHQRAFQLHFLGEYWIVPDLSLDQEGSLNAKHKASMVHPHITPVDPGTRRRVKEMLSRPLLLMYKRMLGFDDADLEEGVEEALVTGLDRDI